MKVFKFIVMAGLLSVTSFVNATLITVGGSEVNSPDIVFGFETDSISNGVWEPLTNQFTTQGLTVVNNIGYANLMEKSNCLPGNFNPTGTNYLTIGVSEFCGVSNTSDDVTFNFSNVVNAMSFDIYTHSTGHQFEIFLYNELTQVGYKQFNGTNQVTEVFSVTGTAFDSFQIREFGSNSEWLWMDQLAVTYADSTEVPEPSTLAILALGMIGLASRRFKKQS